MNSVSTIATLLAALTVSNLTKEGKHVKTTRCGRPCRTRGLHFDVTGVAPRRDLRFDVTGLRTQAWPSV